MKATGAHALPSLVLVITAGCSTSPSWLPLTRPAEDETVLPTCELRANDSRTAQAPPERTGRERAAETLYRLGLLQADPTSGIRDYWAARATFTRLLSEGESKRTKTNLEWLKQTDNEMERRAR